MIFELDLIQLNLNDVDLIKKADLYFVVETLSRIERGGILYQ